MSAAVRAGSADMGLLVAGVEYATLSSTGLAVNAVLTAGALNTARGSIAMHATTMDIWAQPNIIDGTGSAVTITAIANAPQAGATRLLYPITGTIITHGATFVVEGGQSYTALAGDGLIFEAVTTSTYKVWIQRKALVGAPTTYAVGARPLTTNFTQSTARLRAVYVTLYRGGADSDASLIVDGVAVSTGYAATAAQATLFAIVPKGGVYSATGTNVAFGTWAEQDIG